MKRKDQKINMLQQYIEAHNNLIDFTNKNSNFIQEGLFKFPKPNAKDVEEFGLTEITDEINNEEYITHMHDFLTENFSDYEIKTIIAHVDEAKIHSHYFLSGKNELTGHFDLAQREVEIVNEYIKKTVDAQELAVELLPTGRKLQRYEQERFGRYFQRLFFSYTNDKLLEKKGVYAEIAPETERRSALAKERNKQSNLPKMNREFNYANHQIELAKEKEKECLIHEERLVEIDSEIHEKSNVLSDLKTEIEASKVESKSLSDALSGLKQQFVERFLSITQDLRIKSEYLFKNNPLKAKEITEKIMVNYAEITEKPCRDLCKSAAISYKDNEVVDLMNKEDDLNNSF